MLEGFFDEKDLPIIAVNNIETVVHNREQLEALKRAVVPSPIKVWLKIDTGMHRLGVSLDEVDYFYQELKKLPQIQPHLGFVSHFSRADELDSDYTQVQLDRFLQATKDKEWRANHCGIWRDPILARSASRLYSSRDYYVWYFTNRYCRC